MANWQLQAGIVNGWNNLVQQQNHAQFPRQSQLLRQMRGGARWRSSPVRNSITPATCPTSLTLTRTEPDIVSSWTCNRRADCEYVFHQWLGSQVTGAPGGGTALWYGIDQYLYYKLADKWRLGTRIEWFRDQSGTRVGLTQPGQPQPGALAGELCVVDVGVNWTPTTNVMLRPEIRWDSYSGPAKPFDDGLRTYQFLVGMDAILQF